LQVLRQMVEPKFVHYDLKLTEPSFRSPLTDLIIELDYLRKKRFGGSTHPMVFLQLKHIFHTLESIGSARIEGNNTTLAEFIETKLEDHQPVSFGFILSAMGMEEQFGYLPMQCLSGLDLTSVKAGS